MSAPPGEGAGRPALSIVIVNSDGWDDTMACIESIYRNPPRESFEIVLIDNRSRRPGLEEVARRYPEVRAAVAPARQGFARNYNQGIRASLGELVLVLNNDTLMVSGALDTLVGALRAEQGYGMVGPRLIGRDGAIQAVCARDLPTPAGYMAAQLVLDPGFPPGWLWAWFLAWRSDRRPSGPVPCISGACMLVRRSDIEALGMLDEGYDFYCEDVEWCHRFQQAGRGVGYVREAQVIHLGDQSLSRVKVWARKSEYRSVDRYFRQYCALSRRLRRLLWLSVTANSLMRGLAMLGVEALLGVRAYAREYLYIWAWLLGQRPATDEDE